MNISRRDWIRKSAMLTAFLQTGFLSTNAFSKAQIRIGACDWSMGKDSDAGSFAVAKEIGLAGVQVNLGSVANNMHLRDAEVQNEFLEASKLSGIAIASLAIAELNQVPYKSDPRTEAWVWDGVDVAKALGVNVILLAFFHNNDLRGDTHGRDEVVKRLKMVAPKAEKYGITLGIESYLSAEEHMDIIQRVGSKNVKVFYDFRNSAVAGYDVVREIQWLGKDAIYELHMKENGFLLGKGTLNWEKICETLLKMDYTGDGWMQIEWAMAEHTDVVLSYRKNLAFLRQHMRY